MGNNEKTFTIPDALQLLAKKKLKLEEEEEGLNSLLSFFSRKKKNVGITWFTLCNSALAFGMCKSSQLLASSSSFKSRAREILL